MEQTINFNDVLKICNTYLENPGDANKQKLMQELQNRIIIRAYLPMGDKVIALYKMILDNDKSVDLHSSIFTVGMELSCLFNGLLAYTNIIDITDELKTYESYDTLYQSGLADYIWEYCFGDYEKLVRLFERAVNYTNLVELTETISKMDSKGIDEILSNFKTIKNSLDSQTIQNLADIAKYNDPLLHQIKTDVVDGALDQLDRLETLEKLEKNKKS